MKETLLIINGSARENGNTDSLLKSFIDGLEKAKRPYSYILLRNKQINNCVGCYKCQTEGICSIEDDLTEIRKEIEKSDKIVFASPLYFTGVTGLMKTFFDRLFFYYHERNKKLISNKRALIITTMNQTDIEKEANLVKKYYKIMLKCIGLEIEDMLFYTNLMAKDAHRDNPLYHEEIYRIGLNI